MNKDTKLFHNLLKLYTNYSIYNVSPMLYQCIGEDKDMVAVDYGDKGRNFNLLGLITDWDMVGRVASKGLPNSKKRKIRKIVEGKHRKAVKRLRKSAKK